MQTKISSGSLWVLTIGKASCEGVICVIWVSFDDRSCWALNIVVIICWISWSLFLWGKGLFSKKRCWIGGIEKVFFPGKYMQSFLSSSLSLSLFLSKYEWIIQVHSQIHQIGTNLQSILCQVVLCSCIIAISMYHRCKVNLKADDLPEQEH